MYKSICIVDKSQTGQIYWHLLQKNLDPLRVAFFHFDWFWSPAQERCIQQLHPSHWIHKILPLKYFTSEWQIGGNI